MVVEAHSGGLGKEMRQIMDAVAKSISATQPKSNESASLRVAQRVSITLHRENARAIVKRLSEAAEDMNIISSLPTETGEAVPSILPLW